MPDFSGFFAAVERALFEVATWVFLIPKTLYLVLSHPSKVPEYVRGELSARDEKRARFHGTVSPLLLFLLVALGPFLLIQLVQVPKAPIEGEPTGVVGSQSEFRAYFEKIPWANWMKITWSIENVDSAGDVWAWNYRENCFWDLEPARCEFVEFVLSVEADADQEPAALFDEALGNFAALVDDGMSLDEARRVVAEAYGPIGAQSIYDYWCSWPPGSGCDPAVDRFLELVEQGDSPDEAAQLVADQFSPVEAQKVYDYWCSWPPGRGCDPVFDQFVLLVEEGMSADAARWAIIAAGADESKAQRSYDYWCAPPSGPGCYSAPDRLDELPAEGMTEEQARAAITPEFGTAEFEDQSSGRPAEIAGADRAPTVREVVPGPGSPELTGYFFGDALTWLWEEPGRYRISAQVRDMESDKLLDQSEFHEIVVNRPQVVADVSEGAQKEMGKLSGSPKARGQGEEPRRTQGQSTGQEENGAGGKINAFLQSPETAGLALAFLMFPLVLTLATELHRSRPLTQSTIKPAFYAQCLYLSPLVVSIWIPILLLEYHPEPDQEFLFAFLLAAVIFLWLVIAEVRFVREERSVSLFKAILWLAVPVAFVVTSLFLVAFFAAQHKYAIVEWVGNIVMALMLIPFIASGFVRLWRWITRRKVERPFHGGEW